MARYRDPDPPRDRPPPLHVTPPGACDYCGRFAMGRHQCGFMDEPGALCDFCRVGHFRLEGFWRYDWCPVCWWRDPFCKACHGRGVIATPREQRDYPSVFVRFSEDGTALLEG